MEPNGLAYLAAGIGGGLASRLRGRGSKGQQEEGRQNKSYGAREVSHS